MNMMSKGTNGPWDTPMYNEVSGFKSGAQYEIFAFSSIVVLEG